MTSPSLVEPHARTGSRPQSGLQRIGVPALLFLVTLCSTTAVGMRYMYNFKLGRPPLASDADILPIAWVWGHLSNFAAGIPFSLTLITILLAHEFGHYFACRAFKVRSSLPYLLPAPSLSGSFGAVIRLKSRVRSRAALIVIGAAGPLAGFVVAIVTSWFGLALSTYAPERVVRLQAPLLMTMLHSILRHLGPGPMLPPLHLIVPHPVLTASWIGLLITSLNLIPAGQLDGGHILYAISPKAHKVSSRLAIATLVLLGVFCWVPWLLWGGILLMPGMRHPQVPDVGEIKARHYALIPACALILLLSGTYQPFVGYSLLNLLHHIR